MFNNMHRLTGRWLRAQLQRLFELLGRALQHWSAGAGGSNRPGWRRRIHLRRRAHDEYCRDAAPPPRRESPSSVARHGPRGVFRGGGRGGGAGVVGARQKHIQFGQRTQRLTVALLSAVRPKPFSRTFLSDKPFSRTLRTERTVPMDLENASKSTACISVRQV